jgi:cytochrome c peroxidase
MASLRPIVDPREIGASAEAVAFIVRTGDGVACRYKAAFGDEPSLHDADEVLVNVAKALAAYEETLVTGRTRSTTTVTRSPAGKRRRRRIRSLRDGE